MKPDDRTLGAILTQAQVIAVVGHSDNPGRTSYQIANFLRRAGYTVYPVNPTISQIEGQPCYPSLDEVPAPIDIVNVFRRSEYLIEVVDAAIAVQAKTVWAQQGVVDAVAAQRAIDADLVMIMDACIKVEYLRLGISKPAP